LTLPNLNPDSVPADKLEKVMCIDTNKYFRKIVKLIITERFKKSFKYVHNIKSWINPIIPSLCRHLSFEI
jgi:hypothetical protein